LASIFAPSPFISKILSRKPAALL
jgi:hypothetical protein